MKKSDLKRTFDSISPSDDLISKTKAKMLAANSQTEDAPDKKPEVKTATVLTPRPSRRKLFQIASSCAAMLVIAAGMIFLYARNGDYPMGGFTFTGSFDTASAGTSASYARLIDQPVCDYESFRSEAVGEENTATMSITATMLSYDIYTSADESFDAYGFCLARISVNEVEKTDGLSLRKPRSGTAVSIVIYLSDERDINSLPLIGETYTFLLASGKDGSPKDPLSIRAGMYNTWKCYDFAVQNAE